MAPTVLDITKITVPWAAYLGHVMTNNVVNLDPTTNLRL